MWRLDASCWPVQEHQHTALGEFVEEVHQLEHELERDLHVAEDTISDDAEGAPPCFVSLPGILYDTLYPACVVHPGCTCFRCELATDKVPRNTPRPITGCCGDGQRCIAMLAR